MARRPNQLTISAGPPLLEVVEGFDDRTRSRRVTSIAERYLAIVEHAMPELAEAEWLAICDVLNGTFREPRLVGMMWAEVESAVRHERLAQKWKIDGEDLVARLRGMDLPQLIAIADAVDRFWSHADLPASRALSVSGARIEGEDDAGRD